MLQLLSWMANQLHYAELQLLLLGRDQHSAVGDVLMSLGAIQGGIPILHPAVRTLLNRRTNIPAL